MTWSRGRHNLLIVSDISLVKNSLVFDLKLNGADVEMFDKILSESNSNEA